MSRSLSHTFRKISGAKTVQRHEASRGYLFILPFFLLVFVFVICVFVNGFFLSLKNAQGIDPGEYVGLSNFKTVIADIYFWGAVSNTLQYTFWCIVTQVPAAFILACWLNSIPFKRIQAVLRAAFFIPFLMNSVVVGMLFSCLFDGDPGIANWILGLLHLPHDFKWMTDASLSFPLLVMVSFWQGIGFQAIYFLANLQTIDQSLYEAARIDGASPRQTFSSITLPLMRPSISFMMVTSAISSMLVFDLIFMLFQRDLNDRIISVIIYIYGKAFYGNFDVGLAAAAGWVAFLIILLVSLIQIRFLGLGKSHHD